MSNDDAAFNQWLSTYGQHLSAEERAALQQQYSDARHPARQDIDTVFNGSGATGVLASDQSLDNRLMNDYGKIFGESFFEGAKKHLLPLLLMLFSSMIVFQINNNFSPGDRVSMCMVPPPEHKNHHEIIEKPDSVYIYNNTNLENMKPHNNKNRIIHKENINHSTILPDCICSDLCDNTNELELKLKMPTENPPFLISDSINQSLYFYFSGHSFPQTSNNYNFGFDSSSFGIEKIQFYFHPIRPNGSDNYLNGLYSLKKSDNRSEILKITNSDLSKAQYINTPYFERTRESRETLMNLTDYLGEWTSLYGNWEINNKDNAHTGRHLNYRVHDKYFIEKNNSVRDFIKAELALREFYKQKLEDKLYSYNIVDNVKTDLSVKAGSLIFISAHGTMYLNKQAGACTPAGLTDQIGVLSPPDNTVVPGLPYGALLYRIGDQDNWKPYDPSAFSIRAEHDGYLELMINDRDLKDNYGSYTVEVGIFRKE